jgi:hypothetical protein
MSETILIPGYLYWDGSKYILTPGTAGTVFTANGDLSGSPNTQKVIGLQTIPISSTHPTNGQVLTYNGSAWAPATAASGSFTASQDLSGTSTVQRVVGIQTIPVLSTAPTSGQVLAYNGSAWAPATASSGSGGGNSLVFRPGGTTAGTVYATWAALWIARLAINGPATIYIDDSISSPATIETSSVTYDLKKETALVGYRNSTTVDNYFNSTPTPLVWFQIPDTVHFLNPSYFAKLRINATDSGDVGVFQIGAPFTTLDIDARDTTFWPDSGTTFSSPGGTFNLYGSTQLFSNAFAYFTFSANGSGATYTFNLFDAATVNDGAVAGGSDSGGTSFINIYSGAAQFPAYSGNIITSTINYNGGYFIGNWTSASVGYVLTKSDETDATWQPSAAGIDVQNQSSDLGTGFNLFNFTGAGVTAAGSSPNATITIPGFTAGQDLSGTNTAQTVIGIQGQSVPTPTGTNTTLQWTGSAFTWAAGGGGYNLIQQNTVPLTTRTTFNIVSGGKVSDDSTNTSTDLAITITDNGIANRTFANKEMRTNGYTGVQYGEVASIIGPQLGGGNVTPGRSMTTIGDYLYVGGFDQTYYGALYGIDTVANSSLTASSVPIHDYNSSTPSNHDGPALLLGVRSTVINSTFNGNVDFIFAAGAYTGASTFLELGYLTSGGSVYNQVYRHNGTVKGPIYQGVCLGSPPITTVIASGSDGVNLGTSPAQIFTGFTTHFPATGTIYVSVTGGGTVAVNYTSITNGSPSSFNGCTYPFGGSGTINTGNAVATAPEVTPPSFAILDANQHLYVVDSLGNLVQTNLTTTNFYGITIDDQGFVWMLGGGLRKYSVSGINSSTTSSASATFTQVGIVSLSSGNYSSSITFLFPDGKYIWGVAPNADPNGAVHFFAYDMSTCALVNTFSVLDTNCDINGVLSDGEFLWLNSFSFDENYIQLFRIHPETGEVLYKSPILNNLSQLSSGHAHGLAITDSGDVFQAYTDYDAVFGPAFNLYRAAKPAQSLRVNTLIANRIINNNIGANWNTVMDLDFTTLPNQTLTTDGTYTFNGIVWTKVNTAQEYLPMQIITGQGLKIQPNNAPHAGILSNRSWPLLQVPVLTLASGIGPLTRIRVWLYWSALGTFPGGTGDDSGPLISLDNTSTSPNYAWWGRYSNGQSASGPGYYLGRAREGDGRTSGTITGPPPTGNVMVFDFPAGIGGQLGYLLSGTFASGWPGESALLPMVYEGGISQNVDGGGGYQTVGNSIAVQGPLSSFVIAIGSQGSVGYSGPSGYYVTFGRVRFDVYS